MFIRRLTDYQRLEKGLAYRQVIDAAGATIAFSPSDVRATVAILKGYGQEAVLGPTAIVVGNDLAFGMFRMLSILLEGVCELQPFRASQSGGTVACRGRPPQGTSRSEDAA
jgi:hypothetical protein